MDISFRLDANTIDMIETRANDKYNRDNSAYIAVLVAEDDRRVRSSTDMESILDKARNSGTLVG